MLKNSFLGFTLQALICNSYDIIPDNERAINTFNSSYDSSLEEKLKPLIENIFSSLNLYPIECTLFNTFGKGNKSVPYNFILNDNSTLSIRTNYSGDKVSPREVGQAGFEKLNKYFGNIYEKEIRNQDDIKELCYEKIDKILPIFFEHLFDADYIVWIYVEEDSFKFNIIKSSTGVNMIFNRNRFSFTRDLTNWVESTTLKYDNKSIAEIQVHKNRSFKFRFIMKNIIPYFVDMQQNNETFGLTAEKTICDMFGLSYPQNFYNRFSPLIQKKLEPFMAKIFRYIPRPIKYCGNERGSREGNSKSPYDFILEGDLTLSLKTNMSEKVCPPEVGQPCDTTCYNYFKEYIDGDSVTKDSFKIMVFKNIEKIMPIYVEHLFDSDFLLRIKEKNGIFDYNLISKNFGSNFKWDKEKFSFSQKDLSHWKESNTVYYDGKTLGEFQVHNNRNCFKFRFHYDNLINILNN